MLLMFELISPLLCRRSLKLLAGRVSQVDLLCYNVYLSSNGVKYSEANSALLIPRHSRQSKSRGEMAAKTLDVAVWLCIFQMNNNVFPSEFLLQMFRVAVAVKTILVIMCAIQGFGFAMTICTDSTAHLLFMFLW